MSYLGVLSLRGGYSALNSLNMRKIKNHLAPPLNLYRRLHIYMMNLNTYMTNLPLNICCCLAGYQYSGCWWRLSSIFPFRNVRCWSTICWCPPWTNMLQKSWVFIASHNFFDVQHWVAGTDMYGTIVSRRVCVRARAFVRECISACVSARVSMFWYFAA